MDPNERSIVPLRVAGVGAALAGTGAVLGAGLSAGLMALGSLALRAASVPVPGGSILATAGIGAALGAVLTPMTALSLLRQVALATALLFTLLGLSLGVSVGQLASGRALVAGAAGFGAFPLTALLVSVWSGLKSPGRR